jgi:hypothetical protein
MLVNTFRNIWNHILYIIYASVAPGEYYQIEENILEKITENILTEKNISGNIPTLV